jgi:ribosomal-protein-alanine N-acetyltransferase
MTQIRPAQSSDLATVRRWLPSHADCEMWAGDRVSFPVDLTALPVAIEWRGSDPWAVVHCNEIVAFGQLVSKPAGRLHIARVIVAPDHRANGHGRTLTAHLLDLAIEAGAPVVSLNVLKHNERAIALYRSLGFAKADRPADESESLSLYMTHVV